MENKKKTVLPIVAGLVLLLIAVIGATYAFFSATASITEQSLSVHAATPTGLIYDGVGLLSMDNAIPGDRTTVKSFTIENPESSSTNQLYELALHIDANDFTKNHVKNANDSEDYESGNYAIGQLLMFVGYGNCEVDETNDAPLTCDNIVEVDLTDSTTYSSDSSVDLFSGLIEPNESQQYYVYLKFNDINVNQNENRNKTFGAHIELQNTRLIKDEELPYNELDLNNKVERKLRLTNSQKTLEALNLTERFDEPSFTTVATEDETAGGLYGAYDDQGKSYYFRGASENNYVKFGKNANNEDMYWRIIRINGNGTIRMIYDGTQAWENGAVLENGDERVAISEVSWNLFYSDNIKFGGYMYGGNNESYLVPYYQADMTASNYANSDNAVYNETDSNAKTLVDSWYEQNILNTGYSNYIADEVFCNDRIQTTVSWSGYTVDGFAGAKRIGMDFKPTFKCLQKNDSFTVGTSNSVGQDDVAGHGNGYLKYPVGLLTTDEVSYAGAALDTSNYDYYLFKGSPYWLFNPGFVFWGQLGMGIINGDGSAFAFPVTDLYGLAPVISIKTGVDISGSGTMQDPYVFTGFNTR